MKIEELASKGKACLVKTLFIGQSSTEDSRWSGDITIVSLRKNEREEWDQDLFLIQFEASKIAQREAESFYLFYEALLIKQSILDVESKYIFYFLSNFLLGNFKLTLDKCLVSVGFKEAQSFSVSWVMPPLDSRGHYHDRIIPRFGDNTNQFIESFLNNS